jgi:hypothetical protein
MMTGIVAGPSIRHLAPVFFAGKPAAKHPGVANLGEIE